LHLDPAPRVIVDAQWGTWTASIDARHAAMTAEIYRHDVAIITRANGHDRYAGLPRSAILDAEIHYGGFEARARASFLPEGGLLGEVALILGDPVQQPMIRQLRERGAEVVMAASGSASDADLELDREARTPLHELRKLVKHAGGLDIVVLVPGMEHWLDECIRLLRFSPRGGRIVLHGAHEWCVRMRFLLADISVRAFALAPGDAALSEEIIETLCVPYREDEAAV